MTKWSPERGRRPWQRRPAVAHGGDAVTEPKREGGEDGVRHLLTSNADMRTARPEEGRRWHGGARRAEAVVGEEGVDAAVGSRASRPDSAVGEGEEVGAEVMAASPGPGELQRRRIDGDEVGTAADRTGR